MALFYLPCIFIYLYANYIGFCSLVLFPTFTAASKMFYLLQKWAKMIQKSSFYAFYQAFPKDIVSSTSKFSQIKKMLTLQLKDIMILLNIGNYFIFFITK